MADNEFLQVEEVGGEAVDSLLSAQRAASPEFVRLLSEKIRRMIEDGILIIENGVIIPGSVKNGID